MATNGTQSVTEDLLVPSTVSRLNYFFGQLLTERDLKAEQSYHVLVQRLLQRETLGTGTVAGLGVTQTLNSVAAPDGSVYLLAGLALDQDGRELLLGQDQCVKIAANALTENTTPWITADDATTIATAIATNYDISFDVTAIDELVTRLEALPGYTEVSTDPLGGPYPELIIQLNKITPPLSPPGASALGDGQTPVDYLFDLLIATTYLALRYHERGSEPAPAVLDASCCGTSSCFPARLLEGVAIVRLTEPPLTLVDPHQNARLALEKVFTPEEAVPSTEWPTLRHNCMKAVHDYVVGSWRGIPATPSPCGEDGLPVVPVACIQWTRFARDTSPDPRILGIDDSTCRPIAPGLPMVRALVEVLTQCHDPLNATPNTPILPRIWQVEPAYGEALTLTGTAPALSGDVRVQTTAPLEAPGTFTWIIEVFPDDGSGSFQWSDSSAPADPVVTVGLDGSDASVVVVNLAYSAVAPVVGRYELTINNSQELHVLETLANLDGTPNPITRLPTAGADPAGAPFTTVFRIV